MRYQMTTQSIRNALKKRLHEQLWLVIARRQSQTGRTMGTVVVVDAGHSVVNALQRGPALDILASLQPLNTAACVTLTNVVSTSVANHARAVSSSVEQALGVAAAGRAAAVALQKLVRNAAAAATAAPPAAAAAGPPPVPAVGADAEAREVVIVIDGALRPEENRLPTKVAAARELCSRAARRAAHRAEFKEARRAQVGLRGLATVLPAEVRTAVIAKLRADADAGLLAPIGWVVRIVEATADADSHVRKADFYDFYEVRGRYNLFVTVSFI